jgi:hypothetical protein
MSSLLRSVCAAGRPARLQADKAKQEAERMAARQLWHDEPPTTRTKATRTTATTEPPGPN